MRQIKLSDTTRKENATEYLISYDIINRYANKNNSGYLCLWKEDK